VKAYARRGAARMAMKKYSQAEEDFKQVIKLDPSNKQARTELNTVHQVNILLYLQYKNNYLKLFVFL